MADAVVHRNCRLTSINLGGKDEMRVLSRVVIGAERTVSDNQIGVVGARALAQALVHDDYQLLSMNLGGELSSQSTRCTGFVMPTSRLASSGNHIGDCGTQALTDSLVREYCRLTSIDISGEVSFRSAHSCS